MDWFENLMGFKEGEYEWTREQFDFVGGQMQSLVNRRTYRAGKFELLSLRELRQQVSSPEPAHYRLTFRNITGDVRALHRQQALKGALFQVASQFNMLEMTGPEVSPEDGVTRYEHDRTQGPACAIAAGAATIYRNYFVPLNGQFGQTSAQQLDGLAELGTCMAEQLGSPGDSLWTMRNGYAMCSRDVLKVIGSHLRNASEADRDNLRSKLRIGVHSNVEVTEADAGGQTNFVSQAFCSALPVAYSGSAPGLWQPFAELVLEAAYEATLLAAVRNMGRAGSNIVLLTLLGGGAFGNDAQWIKDAISRALSVMRSHELDVRLVNYGAPPMTMVELEGEHRRIRDKHEFQSRGHRGAAKAGGAL